jgi:hypothetical protein
MKTSVLERFWSKVNVGREDECWLWSAYRNNHGYGQVRIKGRLFLAHRHAYEISVGPIPGGMHIDHMCHTPACVNPGHLRAVTVKQNQENRAGAQRDSKSGVRGVWWRPGRNKWQAQVEHNGRVYTVGSFTSLQEAEAAVKAKRLELFTHNDADRLEEGQ